jgi:hypothetical protein
VSGGIFLIQSDESLIEMVEQQYDTEDLLQGLLERYPDLLAGAQINPEAPRKWLLVRREMALASEAGGAGRWSVDHLFLDQDAVPTIVEVKRSTDTRIRREVVGQMLDYAANAVLYWPVETLRAQFETACQLRGADPAAELAALLGPAADEEGFWQRVKVNLQGGRVRLVFVADEIPAELRRIVEFLNQQMDPAEVLAIEVRQYVGHGLKTLVPNLLGASKLVRPSTRWDERTLFAALLERHGAGAVEVARSMLDWAASRTSRTWWGKGAQNGSFVPVLHANGVDHQAFAVFTSGTIELYFQWYRTRRPFDDPGLRGELLERFNRIPGVDIPASRVDGRPNIPLRDLADPERRRMFIEVLDWWAEQVRLA